MKKRKKTKLFILLLISICLIVPTFEIIGAEAPPGYYIGTIPGCTCKRVGSTEIHTIGARANYSPIFCQDGTTHHAHGAPGLNYGTAMDIGYYCNGNFVKTGGALEGSTKTGTCPCGEGYSCRWPGNSYSGRTSGTVTCSNHYSYICGGGHIIPINYKVSYTSTATGSKGTATQTMTYDKEATLHNGTGFSRECAIDFVVIENNGSTAASSTSILTRAQIVGWKNTITNENYTLSQKQVFNLTTQKDATVTLDAIYGTFSSIVVPNISRDGYQLAGYTSDKNKAGVKMDGDVSAVEVKPGDTIVPQKDEDMWYAIWVPNTYTIKFDANNLKYDTNHATTISGKTYKEYYTTGTTNVATTSGAMSNITVKFDGTIQIPANKYTKTSKGFYGQTVNYNLIGWSQSKFSSYDSKSRTTYDKDNRTTQSYYGYYTKKQLNALAYANYLSGSKTTNAIYFYPNEKINNYMFNGQKLQYNLSKGGDTITLYANWIPENQRPYTYFRLATKQYNQDGTWTGYIQNTMYDENPANIYDYNDNKTIVYDDMPIYLDTVYYDPEGRVDFQSFYLDYQYSIDGGTTWYELKPNITTPNFTTKLVTIENTKLSNSKNLDNSYVIDNSNSKNIIFGANYAMTETNTYMVEINFKSDEAGKTTLIRSRARDTVDYPTMLTNVTRNEETNKIEKSTKAVLQKPLWSTGYYAKDYSSSVDGTVVNEYTGAANSWNGQKAFVQNTKIGKTTGDNAGWYVKEITCYEGNSSNSDTNVISDFDNLLGVAYPLHDYTKNKTYLMVSKTMESNIESKYGEVNVVNALKQRNYVKTLSNGETVDWTTKYKDNTTIIRESLSASVHEDNINRMYTTMVPGDESVGFINISVDKDSYKHYTQNANPTYNIDNQYTKKYYHTGDNKNNVQYDNQFLLYFVAIYDEKGNEVITQAGNKTAASYDANGLPKNGTLYTFSKAQTGLSSDITGHVYTSYDNMVNDIYARTNAIFAEHSDLIEGKYTIYIGVCDKSWNIYSPNKWSIEKSELNIQPRLSFRDISMGDFRQTGYKNEYQLDANGKETNVKIPSSLFLKSNNGTIVQTTANGRTYTFPMYRLPKYTVTQTIAGNKYYMTDYAKTQKDQYGLANGNYVSDTALGYSKNNTYVIKTGYNFSVIVDSIGADYVQLEFYSVEDNKKIEMMVPDISEYTSDSSSVLKRGERRQDGSWEFILAFPEQIDCKGVYGKIYLYKTSLTNGQKELTRSITLGSKETPLIVFDESSLLNDLGVSVTN